jgi:hypothetical protein
MGDSHGLYVSQSGGAAVIDTYSLIAKPPCGGKCPACLCHAIRRDALDGSEEGITKWN